jgi:general stress protein YciG
MAQQNQNQSQDQDKQQSQSGGGQGQQGGSQNSNPGNFANDREKASEAGRKGGQS